MLYRETREGVENNREVKRETKSIESIETRVSR